MAAGEEEIGRPEGSLLGWCFEKWQRSRKELEVVAEWVFFFLATLGFFTVLTGHL